MENIVVYIDGAACQQKRATLEHRQSLRSKALKDARKEIMELKGRVERNDRVRKQQFISIQKHLNNAFHWNQDARMSFAAFLMEKGWRVRECEYEADVNIASDCKETDIVVTRDSDMLGHSGITTIWRPLSRQGLLIYNVPDLLKCLEMTRHQLTVFCTVSRNDYTRNVPSLGPQANYGIVKSLEGEDSRDVLQKYLAHEQVVCKNKEQLTFKDACDVFIELNQTPLLVEDTPMPSGSNVSESPTLSPTPTTTSLVVCKSKDRLTFKDSCHGVIAIDQTSLLATGDAPSGFNESQSPASLPTPTAILSTEPTNDDLDSLSHSF
ncbi:hypothetical protein BGZ65_012553 [Modicella reniformis]|uniref:Uncharacterized protein n=1 Tax=Modicella reniformis TaxID=1440133 RepID=A0A9P6IMQ5_9FUNG|nr:hypothetical protein BGZ65_012553 [Modicella reniformis]